MTSSQNNRQRLISPKSYGILRTVWRLLPEHFRERALVRAIICRLGSKLREHQQNIYTRDYYLEDVEGAASSACAVIARSIERDLKPKRVVDVGCGTGALLAEVQRLGIEALGLEYSRAGCEITRQKSIAVQQFDVRFDDVDPGVGRFDVACCTEVAEHIPKRYVNRLVSTLIRLAPLVVFTAAAPGQGGVDHVNLQPAQYWIERFRRGHYLFRDTLTRQWSLEWRNAGIAEWYWRNLLVFSSPAAESADDEPDRLQSLSTRLSPIASRRGAKDSSNRANP